MEKNSFEKAVGKQLERMTVEEKDRWILREAKLLPQHDQQGFLDTLLGRKTIPYMPDDEEIEKFCARIESGELYVEYETHYFEFNSEGRYVDDWDSWYNDPFNVMQVINQILRGCHQLNELGEYERSYQILNRIIGLEFVVEESADSEDSDPEDTPFTLARAFDFVMLAVTRDRTVYDWFLAYYESHKEVEETELARKMLWMIRSPLCKKMVFSNLIPYIESRNFFDVLKDLLERQIQEEKLLLDSENCPSMRWYAQKIKLDRLELLLKDIEKINGKTMQ